MVLVFTILDTVYRQFQPTNQVEKLSQYAAWLLECVCSRLCLSYICIYKEFQGCGVTWIDSGYDTVSGAYAGTVFISQPR